MSEEKQSECQPTRKICDFTPNSESEELKILVNNPAYVCMECGRSAHKGENLCQPERMYSSW
jgi:hypothetical protein